MRLLFGLSIGALLFSVHSVALVLSTSLCLLSSN